MQKKINCYIFISFDIWYTFFNQFGNMINLCLVDNCNILYMIMLQNCKKIILNITIHKNKIMFVLILFFIIP